MSSSTSPAAEDVAVGGEEKKLFKKRPKLKNGDHIIQVHVIEGRELRGLGRGDMSDPCVKVEVLDKKRSTRIHKRQANAYFDEVLVFEFAGLTVAELQQAKIKITTVDANTLMRDAQIGSFEFDVSSVYFKEGHEIYRQWVALSDTRGKREGVQGYLRVSVTVLGPDDEQVTHDEEVFDEDESEMLCVLMPPEVEQDPHLLTVTVHEVRDMPVMDTGVIGGKCDPFVSVHFASNKVKTSTGKGLCHRFDEALSLPVFEPVLSQCIVVKVKDWDVGSDDLIGTAFFDYADLKEAPNHELGPMWVHLYGAPHGKQAGFAKRMNRGLVDATSYRGRVLLSMQVEPCDRPEKQVVEVDAPDDDKLPSMQTYGIQCDLYEGCELPKQSKFLGVGQHSFTVEVCCGANVWSSRKASPQAGRASWHQALHGPNDTDFLALSAPSDPAQAPDIFIYLVAAKKRVCYWRRSFVEALEEGWNTPPRWHMLKEDRALDKLDDNIMPGALLFSLRVGATSTMPPRSSILARPFATQVSQGSAPMGEQSSLDESFDEEAPLVSQNSMPTDKETRYYGVLNVEVMNGAQLPAADRNGLSDPFLVLKLGDEKRKTTVKKNTLNPTWNENFMFENVDIDSTLKVKVYDHDRVGGNDKLGAFEVPLQQASDQEYGCDFAVTQTCFISAKHPQARVQLRLMFVFTHTAERKLKKRHFLRRVTQKVRRPTISEVKPGYFGKPTSKHFQLRLKVYMGRRLRALDKNGASDPYLQARIAGCEECTSARQRTLSPTWLEHLALNAWLPFPLDLAPPLQIAVFDKDRIGKDECMGMATLWLHSMPHGEPHWITLCDADGNELAGQVLLSVDLLPSEQGGTAFEPLTPPGEHKWLQMAMVGLRDITGRTLVRKPYVELVSEDNTRNQSQELLRTRASNTPSRRDPNFLQLFKLPLRVPDDPLFAPTLQFAAKDSLFGGMVKRQIGMGSLDLEPFVRLAHDPEAQEAFRQGVRVPVIDLAGEQQERDEKRLAKLREQRELEAQRRREEARARETLLLEVLDTVAETAEKQQQEAKEHNPHDAEDSDDEDARQRILSDVAGDTAGEETDQKETADSLDNESEFAQKIFVLDAAAASEHASFGDKEDLASDKPFYMVGRDTYDDELEDVWELAPFLNVPFYRGSESKSLSADAELARKKKKSKHKQVASLKALVAITDTKQPKEGDLPANLDELLTPQHVFVRVYVLRGRRLTPKDNDGTCDPYLKVRLGKTTISTRSRYKKNTCDPEFFECFELPASLPGHAKLHLDVWDWDGIGDDYVGGTVIDVEDRWFARKWRLADKKPLECRTLHAPSSSFAQGKLEVWVDVLAAEDAKRSPILDISPPPPQPFELRVIIWGCKDVAIKDTITDMNDLYVTGQLELGRGAPVLKRQQTDTHMRAQGGMGNFNWRMKFPVELPLKKSPRFRLQLWDRDFFSPNDSICEVTFSLASLFRRAHRLQDRVVLRHDGEDKIWINNLSHPNFEGNQGRVQVSFEVLPLEVAEQLPAGLGRGQPNANPHLPPPEGRVSWSLLHPFAMLRAILGDKIFARLGMFICVLVVIGFLVMIGPSLVSSIVANLIT